MALPTFPVRTALVDRPPFMTWPHVERDGILCLLPNMAECDPDDPCAVAENLLNRSVRLVEELLEGAIVERDFREEFLTYWAYMVQDGRHFVSLLTPTPPSRVVRVWRGKGLEIVGEDAETLSRWVHRRFATEVDATSEVAVFIWLPKPPLPDDYPNSASDLRALAVAAGQEAAVALAQAAAREPDHLVAILGATGRGGAGLVAVKVEHPKLLRFRWALGRGPAFQGLSTGTHAEVCPARPVFRHKYRRPQFGTACRCQLGARAWYRSPSGETAEFHRRGRRVRIGWGAGRVHASTGGCGWDCSG